MDNASEHASFLENGVTEMAGRGVRAQLQNGILLYSKLIVNNKLMIMWGS